MTEQQPTVIPHAKKLEIQNALQSRIRSGCPRCGGNSGTLADGYTYHPLQNGDPNAGVQNIFGTIICAVIICNTCGYLTEYSLPHLGITPSLNVKKVNQALALGEEVVICCELAPEVHRTVDDPHQFNPVANRSIENQILPDRKAPEPWS